MKTFTSIKQWNQSDQPKEKLLKRGVEHLSDAELLAILINTGTVQKTALDIANELLSSCENSLATLGRMSVKDLNGIKGIGLQKAITIITCMELGKRRMVSTAHSKPILHSPQEIFELLQPYFIDKKSEEFYVVYLNHAQKMMAVHQLHTGGINAVMVDVRLMFKKALELNGVTKIILAHNHPSGELRPSEADKQVTNRVKELGNLFDIKLLDHLIISDNRYFSFADEGIL